MKNKTFFSIILIGAIFLPLFIVLAQETGTSEIVPSIQTGSTETYDFTTGGGYNSASGTEGFTAGSRGLDTDYNPASGTGSYNPASGTEGFTAGSRGLDTDYNPASGTGGYNPASGTGGYNPASGTGGYVPSGSGGFPTSGRMTIGQFMANVEKYAWIIFATLAILAFVLAGAMFLAARGDPEKLKIARTALFWGIIGAIIAILAYTIRIIIAYVFQTG